MNKQELQDRIDALEEDVAYWSGLFHDEESEVMKLQREIEEVKGGRDGSDSELWDKNYSLEKLWEALTEAETLEDFKEIVEDDHNIYGRPSHTY